MADINLCIGATASGIASGSPVGVPANCIDGNVSTSWGTGGLGGGQYVELTVTFDTPNVINILRLWAGSQGGGTAVYSVYDGSWTQVASLSVPASTSAQQLADVIGPWSSITKVRVRVTGNGFGSPTVSNAGIYEYEAWGGPAVGGYIHMF